MQRLALACLLVIGCGGDDDGPDAAVPDAALDGALATRALYAPPAPGAAAEWGVMPYPSDLYLDGSGHLALATLPTGAGFDPAQVTGMKQALATLDGAGVWSNVYFPVSGAVDPATLAAGAWLVDLEGAPVPVPADVIYRADLGSIVISPQPGRGFEPGRRYAAYLTRALHAADGAALEAAPAFVSAAGTATPSDAALARAQTTLRPLLDALPAATRAELVAATVFETRTVSDLKAMRDIVAATPPVVTVTQVLTGQTELDRAFGVQPSSIPGNIRGSTRPQPHANVAALVHGTITLQNFVNDSPGAQGLLGYDTLGKPRVKATQTVPFTLILPKRTATPLSFAGMPVMLMQHGINSARQNLMYVCDSAAARGIATLGIDIIYHGSRARMATDTLNEISGVAEADGFGEYGTAFPAVDFFHLVASNGVPRAHPLAMRDNLMQAATDIVSLATFVRTGSVAPINTALTGRGLPGDLTLRPEVALLATSFGAMLGAPALAVEPSIKVATLNVVPAGLPFPSLLHSPVYAPSFSAVIYNAYGVASRITAGFGPMDARWDPMVMLWNSALEPGEPTPYARAIMTGSLRGGDKPSLLVMEAWSDESVPNDSTERFAGALGIPRLMLGLPAPPPAPGLRYVALSERTGPLSGNIAAGQTAALALWNPASHAMLDEWMATSDFQPGFPPFTMRPAQIMVTNHIVEHHAMWSGFFADHFAGMPAPRIVDPFVP